MDKVPDTPMEAEGAPKQVPVEPTAPTEPVATPAEPPAPSPAPAPAAPMIPTVASDAAASAKQAVEEATSSVVNYVKDNKQTIIIGLVVGTIALFAIAFVLYWIINRYLNKRRVYRFPATEVPVLGTRITSLNADGVPNSTNGKRQTLSFWVYLYDLDKFKGQPRHVFHRGDREDNFEKASPMIVLDKDSNKLHITFAASTDDTAYKSSVTQYNPSDEQKYNYALKTRGVTIDYVPLQRWVHIAIVMNEEVNGGTITVYVDSELVSVVNSDKKTSIDFGTTNKETNGPKNVIETSLNIQNVDLNKKGNIYVGGDPTDNMGPGFSGLLGRLAIFNYDLNAKDVHREYKRGPVSTVASKLGGYGVRSPLYRIG